MSFNIKQCFANQAGNIAGLSFLTGSAMTVQSGVAMNNPWVIAGGLGLGLAACGSLINNAFQQAAGKIFKPFKTPFQPVPLAAIAGNIPLTINGGIMASQILEAPQVGVAGLFLMASNGALYLTGNLRGLNFFSRDPDRLPDNLEAVSAQGHGAYCVYGAASIIAAGLTLGDHQLSTIGLLFLVDGTIRAVSGDKTTGQAFAETKPLRNSLRPDKPAKQLVVLGCDSAKNYLNETLKIS